MACARSPHVDCMCMNINPLTPPPPLLTHTHTHTHTHRHTHLLNTHLRAPTNTPILAPDILTGAVGPMLL